MTHAPSRLVIVALATVLAVTACQGEEAAGRVRSTSGYSFQPPGGRDWDFDDAGTWTKRADPEQVSFFVRADGGPLASNADDARLLSVVHARVEAMADDGSGRYRDIVTDYRPDPERPCVAYRVTERDHGASNRGEHEAMVMLSRGVSCVNPADRTTFIDVVYSIRHVPGFDAGALIAEGDAVVDSVLFDVPPAD